MPSDDTEAFEHYRILRRDDGSIWELGRGAMGVTYKAIDDNLQKVVALKVINALHVDKESSRDRFLREARAAASLNHRNVAVVHHLGQNAQTFFYAMEFIDGETVDALVRRAGPMPWRQALAIVIQVARALMAAHEKHLVHRDIKPANIMLVPELGEDVAVVKLIDFGLAKTLLEEGSSLVTLSGSGFVGTPLYASPEQCNEEAPDIRSDIYSLGVTLWYMLTGQPPFNGPMGKVFAQHLNTPPPLEQLPVGVPESVRVVLGRMLAKNRADRPQTPGDLRREFDACLREPAPAAPQIPPVPIAPRIPPVPVVIRPLPTAPGEYRRFEGRTEPPVLPPGAVARPGFPQWKILAMVAAVAVVLVAGVWIGSRNSPRSSTTAENSSPTVAPALTPTPVPGSNSTPTPTPTPEVTSTAALVDSHARSLRREIADANYAMQIDDYVGAQAAYRRAIALDADSTEAKDGLEKIRLYAVGETKKGDGIWRQDTTKAVEHYRASAALGDAGGQAGLGYMYQYGEGGLKTDTAKAVELYKLAAAQGNATAQNSLGYMYQHGLGGLSADLYRAVENYKLSAAQGNSSGQNSLGIMYEEGSGGLDADPAKAVEYYKLSAAQENASGEFDLADMYERGKGIARDPDKALDYYKRAATQGSSAAQNRLGYLYELGEGGLNADGAKAVEYYKLAAAQGNSTSQNSLGYMYQHGRGGLTVDMAKAIDYYKQSAALGNASGQYNLGYMYQHGLGGLKTDLYKAVEWYQKAAAQGNAYAENTLGIMYEQGQGGLKADFAKAADLYEQAANQGDSNGQYDLADLYERGKGVPHDLDKAVELYRKAAAQGNQGAKDRLKALGKSLQ